LLSSFHRKETISKSSVAGADSVAFAALLRHYAHMHHTGAVKMESLPVADKADVLGRSALAAGECLGLSHREVGEVVGRNRSTIDRNGIGPDTKSGQLALLLIRIYRSLYALMGGEEANMRHFMQTANRGTGGVPGEQVRDVQGLVRVCEYLDAIRGKG
jgi:hypothetical protein